MSGFCSCPTKGVYSNFFSFSSWLRVNLTMRFNFSKLRQGTDITGRPAISPHCHRLSCMYDLIFLSGVHTLIKSGPYNSINLTTCEVVVEGRGRDIASLLFVTATDNPKYGSNTRTGINWAYIVCFNLAVSRNIAYSTHMVDVSSMRFYLFTI